ncbi:transcriptional regulator [Microscilla marina ATCC 23134]|uniref:Transcriptional regulator n=2 Tax=Microscilla marina TaxID=1027 RepID=A1ZQK4_MICM2|nr:transcriptional regulator [Microscilla marina ATCC 23134]
MAFKRGMTDLEWFGNTEFDTKSGFLYLIQPHQVYKWETDHPWEGYHMMVSPILLQEYNIDFSFFQYEIQEALFLTKDEQTQIETLYTQVHTEYQKDNYELDLLMAYSNLIFTYVGKCYKRQFETRQPLYNKIVVQFKKLLNAYYNNHPQQMPSVKHFANQLNLSSNYFGDLIKHNTGQTASEIIQTKIITEAKRQLRLSDKTIAEIGYDLGFEYPTYFTRLFKKHTGKTPSQFKK